VNLFCTTGLFGLQVHLEASYPQSLLSQQPAKRTKERDSSCAPAQ